LDLGRPALRRKLPVSAMERSHLAIERMERRLTVILAADVAGYSRLMGADEEGTLARLKARLGRWSIPRPASTAVGSSRTTGDGMLVEFVSVVDAVRCAVDIQRGMVERNASVPADRRIEFRIGINVGDIIVEDQDVFGDGVNVAARLEGLADPGAICVSEVKAVLRAITKLWRIRERLVVSSSVRTSAK
jgi:adenylate cyclase